MELELAASTVEVTTSGIIVRWSDGSRSRFHALWLRDNCPSGGPKGSALRTYSVVDLNPEVFVIDVERDENGELVVEFSDGHDSTFAFDWLRSQAHELHDRRGRARQIEHFRAGTIVPRFDLPRLSSERHVDLLDAISRLGVVMVDGVPARDDAGEMVLELLAGPNVDAPPDVGSGDRRDDDSLAVTVTVDGHTLGAEQRVPPGLLFVLGDPTVSSSDVVLIDGFAVASDLRDEDPDAFDLLCEVSVPFSIVNVERSGVPAHEVSHGPIISIDRDHDIAGIRHHEASMAPLDLDPSEVEQYYRALITFATMVRDPRRAIQVPLVSGQAVIWDNHRVLHSGGVDGPATMSGAVERGRFHALLRRLRAEHERHHVDERFPSGVIAR